MASKNLIAELKSLAGKNQGTLTANNPAKPTGLGAIGSAISNAVGAVQNSGANTGLVNSIGSTVSNAIQPTASNPQASANTPYMNAFGGVEQRFINSANAQTEAANKRKDTYMQSVEDQYDKWVAGQNELRDAYLKNMTERQTRDTEKARANYDNTARQNYINYMRAQKQLPEQLRQLGINGGASESSLIRLGTNYNTNVANNEMARAQALDNIASQYTDIINEYEMQYRQAILARDDAKATQLAEYLNAWSKELSDIEAEKNNAINNAYASALENDISYGERQADKEREQRWRDEDLAREAQYRKEDQALAKEQTQYERNRYAQEYKDSQLEKKLEQYAAGLARYQSEDTLKKMAENIKKDKNWAKDPFKYGKVQAINARIGEIRAANKK